MASKMGNALATGVVTVLLCGICSGCQPGSSPKSSGQCGLSVRYDDRLYVVSAGIVPRDKTEQIGMGTIPPCDDQPGHPPGDPSRVKVAKIDHIEIAEAIAVYNAGEWRALVQQGHEIPSTIPTIAG